MEIPKAKNIIPQPDHGSIPSSPNSLIARLEELRRARMQALGTAHSVSSLTPEQKEQQAALTDQKRQEKILHLMHNAPILWEYPQQCKEQNADADDGDAHPRIRLTKDGKPYEIAIVKDTSTSESTIGQRTGQFSGPIVLNDQQKNAVSLACNFNVRRFAIYGSAGTGKTTLLRAAYAELQNLVPAYGEVHKHLSPKRPGIAIVSYTRRAVRNLKRSLSAVNGQDNCITIHKLLEYAPEYYTEINENGEPVEKMRFSPSRGKHNKLHGLKLVVIDEAGMCSVPLHQEIVDAIPHDCRIMYLGDIYQLPPIYGSSILGYALADAAAGTIPYVELTHVYRQALESPILRYALQVKEGRCLEFMESACRKARSWTSKKEDEERDGIVHSELHVMPIQETSKDPEFLNHKFGKMFADSYKAGRFDPDQDVILIPHGKPHTFGSYQLNLHIAQAISEKNELPIYEVIAGYNKLYLSIGDKVAIGSVEGRIVEINRNAKYFGKFARPPSTKIDRWGRGKLGEILDQKDIQLEGNGGKPLMTLHAIDKMLESDKVEDRKAQASHVITMRIEDSDEEVSFSTAGELNALALTYALTVHRSQGAEWRNVYLLLHHVHAGMFSRELLYTAMTRAREKLYVLARPAALGKCVERAVIKGRTLAEKAEFFKGKKEEKERQLSLLSSLDEGMGD